MLPISTKTPVRFCPAEENLKAATEALAALEAADVADAAKIAAARAAVEAAQKALPGAPAYLLAVPTRRQRFDFDAKLHAAAGGFASDPEYFGVLRDTVRALVEPEHVGPLLEVIDEFEAIPFPRNDVPPKLAADLDTIIRTLRPRAPRLSAVEAERLRYLTYLPFVATSMFLIGREGERPLPRLGDVIPDEALEDIPDDHLNAIGWKIRRIMTPTPDDKKNCESGSPSSASPQPSTSASTTPPAPGTSAESATSATPA